MPKCDYSTSIKTTTFVACLAVFNFGGSRVWGFSYVRYLSSIVQVK